MAKLGTQFRLSLQSLSKRRGLSEAFPEAIAPSEIIFPLTTRSYVDVSLKFVGEAIFSAE